MLKVLRPFSRSVQYNPNKYRALSFFPKRHVNVFSDLDEIAKPAWEHLLIAQLKSLLQSKTPFKPADRIVQIFNLLEKDNDLQQFFTLLAFNQFHSEDAKKAWNNYHQNPNIHTNHKLRRTLVPHTENIFNLIYNYNSGGIEVILDMRNKLMNISKIDPAFAKGGLLDSTLKQLIAQSFNPGNLEFRRIQMSQEPEETLDNIIKHESVHPIEDLTTFEHRFLSGKQIFALFHPNFPTNPVSFVSISLLKSMPRTMVEVMEKKESWWKEEFAANCTFYSVNSPHRALSGIDVGNIMIKRTMRHLQQIYTSIKEWSTLSPLPEFVSWLKEKLSSQRNFIPKADLQLLESFMPGKEGYQVLEAIVSDPNCIINEGSDHIRGPILRLAVQYLTSVKPKVSGPYDPVCNFHTRNGATTARLNWKADTSSIRLSQSLGVMVNYVYDERTVDQNIVEFELSKKIVLGKEFLEVMSL